MCLTGAVHQGDSQYVLVSRCSCEATYVAWLVQIDEDVTKRVALMFKHPYVPTEEEAEEGLRRGTGRKYSEYV